MCLGICDLFCCFCTVSVSFALDVASPQFNNYDLSRIFCTQVSVICVCRDGLCIYSNYVIDVTCLAIFDYLYIHWLFYF
jgi:hypothetical protein